MTLEKEALAGEAINIGDKWDYADLLVQVGIIKEREKATLDQGSTDRMVRKPFGPVRDFLNFFGPGPVRGFKFSVGPVRSEALST